MSDPPIKIVLEDGTNTNVVVYPVEGWTFIAVLDALQKASQMFRDGIVKDEESVERRLREAISLYAR